jgi:carbon monoxide dehydrogenase subunit G
MDFRIDATLPATNAELWTLFFDVQRVATLIPGCEDVIELEPLKEFSALMKRKIGPFRLEVPARIVVESHTLERQVVLSAAGVDRVTGTTVDMRLRVDLETQPAAAEPTCRLAVEAILQVGGRLASLGYPIVRKHAEDLFAEFEQRLRAELRGVGVQPALEIDESEASQAITLAGAGHMQAPSPASSDHASAASLARPGRASLPPRSPGSPGTRPQAAARRPRVELVLVWPRVGYCLAVALAVAHAAAAFGQSPWWWVAAPVLGVAAGLGRREAD